MTDAPKPQKYRRTTWIVNPRLQYRLIFLWGSSMVVIFGLLFLAIAKTFSGMMDYVRQSSMDNSAEILLYLEEKNRILEVYVVLGFLLLIIIFVYVQLAETNRIAGPIFNLMRKMKLSREQGRLEKVKFRQDDYFIELADEYNSLVDKFQGNVGKEDEELNK